MAIPTSGSFLEDNFRCKGNQDLSYQTDYYNKGKVIKDL